MREREREKERVEGSGTQIHILINSIERFVITMKDLPIKSSIILFGMVGIMLTVLPRIAWV